MDTGDCQPLYHSIRDYYEGMNMRIDQQIPMLLVERQALNEAIVGEKHVIDYLLHLFCNYKAIHLISSFSLQGFHHMPETRGLCLSEEQTVTSVCFCRVVMLFAFLFKIVNQPIKVLIGIEIILINHVQILGRPRMGGQRRLIGMKTQLQKLTRKCEVTAILVLYGLPRQPFLILYFDIY